MHLYYITFLRVVAAIHLVFNCQSVIFWVHRILYTVTMKPTLHHRNFLTSIFYIQYFI